MTVELLDNGRSLLPPLPQGERDDHSSFGRHDMHMLYCKFGKRLLDILVSLAALILLAPVLAVTALLVRVKLGSPVLFIQQRPGRDGRSFRLLKFRTMIDACGPDGQPLSDDLRMTPFGRFLRSSSLDELPELWNILRGDMSLVGPRPLLERYLPLYSPQQLRRHEVRPGLTGWAQVNGLRGQSSIEDRTRYDLYYIENWSPSLDTKILLQTIPRVIFGNGAY